MPSGVDPGLGAEAERLAELDAYGILDTIPEQAYDDITTLASCICSAPISLVSFVDATRQWFKSRVGLDVSETSRDVAFCSHAIRKPTEMLVVSDALADDRFADNPLVQSDPHIRFYAGAPLVTPAGNALGTLCVIDRVPRTLTDRQRLALLALSRQVVAHLELGRQAGELQRIAEERTRYALLLEQHRRQLEVDLDSMSQRATHDQLTGLKNRSAFQDTVEAEIARSVRENEPLAVAMVDIDRFKVMNDAFGHLAGDEVLNRVAEIISENVRSADVVARFGGDEFALILPDTNVVTAKDVAERVRQAVERAPWDQGNITVSVGITTLANAAEDFTGLVSRADGALYAAKSSGRNQAFVIA